MEQLMKHTMKAEAMGSKQQKKLKRELMASAEQAIEQMLDKNPDVHEGKITVKPVNYPQMTSTVGENEISFTLKLRFQK